MGVQILRQEYLVRNQFDEVMAINALKSQLSSTIFDELIQNEKYGIKVTFLISVIEEEQ